VTSPPPASAVAVAVAVVVAVPVVESRHFDAPFSSRGVTRHPREMSDALFTLSTQSGRVMAHVKLFLNQNKCSRARESGNSSGFAVVWGGFVFVRESCSPADCCGGTGPVRRVAPRACSFRPVPP
jgi:hypothetical protein